MKRLLILLFPLSCSAADIQLAWTPPETGADDYLVLVRESGKPIRQFVTDKNHIVVSVDGRRCTFYAVRSRRNGLTGDLWSDDWRSLPARRLTNGKLVPCK